MKIDLPLPQDKKLTALFRLEPGCLGPQGKEHVDAFCAFAQTHVDPIDADFVHWIIEARHDKTLPEMEYQVNGKGLTHDQADRYLKAFEKSLDEFEEHLHDKIAQLVEEYLVR